MADNRQITLILRPPEGSQAISEQLLAGSYDASKTGTSDVSANPADLKAVTEFAGSHNLQVLSVEPEKRTVQMAGSAADIEKAFGISSSSNDGESGSVESLDYKGAINLPGPLEGIVIAVLGLDKTPIARHHEL